MGTIAYLYRKTLKNKAKKAFKKPITYFFIFIILIYIVMLPVALYVLMEEVNFTTPDKLVAIITVIAFWLIPANLISYAKRKGLVFRKGDVHFLFSSPLSPKKILLYAHIKTLFIYTIMAVIVMGLGIFLFKASLFQVFCYFLFSLILENLLEGSLMVLLYGSEKINEKSRKVIKIALYALMGCFVVIALYMYMQLGLSLESVLQFLHSDVVQMVPIVGWYISVAHLIFVGPTTVNVICSILYVLMVVVLTYLAIKMPCDGEYFEDAMQFAEDYEELLKKKQDGQTARLGKKEKFGKATVSYKGGGAKAIFYRQLLEYKKSKFFFFDTSTLVFMILCMFVGYAWSKDIGEYKEFVLPMAMGYIAFCMSAVQGKWSKEINSPYTFLIPDSPMKKLWYATVMEHIKSFVCGSIIAIPVGIILQIAPIQILLSIVFYVSLQACKVYNTILTEVMVGNVLGKTGRQLMCMLLQGLTIGGAALAALLGVVLVSVEVGYLLMNSVLLLIAFALMTVANVAFDKKEIIE